MRLSLKQKPAGQPAVNDEINRQNRNAGSVYYNPNQFVPVSGGTGMVPTHQQYGSYLMDPTPGQMSQIPPQQITPLYQQSPPHMYPQTVPMYGQPFTQQNIISQQSQLYPTMYAIQPPSRNHSINLTHILPRPAGPATSSNPNQFVPVPGGTGMVPTPQQYGSYLMGPTPGQMDQIPPQQISRVSETSQARGEETESGVQDTSVVGFGQDESMLDQVSSFHYFKHAYAIYTVFYCCKNDSFYLILVLRKPVVGVSDQVPHKPGCTAIEYG